VTEQEAKDKAIGVANEMKKAAHAIYYDAERGADDRRRLLSEGLLQIHSLVARLESAHRVPEGCVRLPDGREVKVFSKAYNKQGESYSIDLRVESTAEEWNAHQQRCRAEWLITNPNGGQLDRKVRQG